MVTNRLSFTRWSLLVSYLAIFYASLFLTMRFRYGQVLQGDFLNEHLVAFSIVYLIWLLIFYTHNLFEVHMFRWWRTLFFSTVSALAFCLAAAALYFYFQPGLILTPRRFLLLHVVITGVLLLLWQVVIKYVLNHRLVENVYVFASGDKAAELLDNLQGYGYMGLRLAGAVDDSGISKLDFNQPVSIVIPDTTDLSPDMLQRFYALRLHQTTFYTYRALYENLTRKVYLENLGEAWFLENISYRRKLFYQFVKRLIDVVAAIVGGLVFLVTYPLIALVIKLASPGTVLFKQPRVGKYGKIFMLYKYRTMSGGPTDTWTTEQDPRITGGGRFLRRLHLDELPQAWNLLKGEMSLVGPRPEQPHIVQDMRQQIPFYEERHSVKPGLTGWGQLNVYARSVDETKTKLQYDLYYIKHRSLSFDLEVILKTIYYVLTNKG